MKEYIIVLSSLPALDGIMIGACGTLMATSFDPRPTWLIVVSLSLFILFFISNPLVSGQPSLSMLT